MTTRKEKGPQKVPLINCGKPRNLDLTLRSDGRVVCNPGISGMIGDKLLTLDANPVFTRFPCENICPWRSDGSIIPNAAHLPPDFTPKPR